MLPCEREFWPGLEATSNWIYASGRQAEDSGEGLGREMCRLHQDGLLFGCVPRGSAVPNSGKIARTLFGHLKFSGDWAEPACPFRAFSKVTSMPSNSSRSTAVRSEDRTVRCGLAGWRPGGLGSRRLSPRHL